MANRTIKFVFMILALVLIVACMPGLSSAPPAAPVLDPAEINKIVVQTANAASTQTIAAIPSSTSTETFTPTPRGTNTPEPTATETFIYVYNSPTVFVIPAATKTIGPSSNKDYACEVIDAPVDGTYYSPRLEFKVRWRLKNVGKKEWEAENVDFVYDSGDKFHKVSGYDLSKDTMLNEVAEFFVELRAPKNPGTYTTYWTLRRGTDKFCRVSFTIGVR